VEKKTQSVCVLKRPEGAISVAEIYEGDCCVCVCCEEFHSDEDSNNNNNDDDDETDDKRKKKKHIRFVTASLQKNTQKRARTIQSVHRA